MNARRNELNEQSLAGVVGGVGSEIQDGIDESDKHRPEGHSSDAGTPDADRHSSDEPHRGAQVGDAPAPSNEPVSRNGLVVAGGIVGVGASVIVAKEIHDRRARERSEARLAAARRDDDEPRESGGTRGPAAAGQQNHSPEQSEESKPFAQKTDKPVVAGNHSVRADSQNVPSAFQGLNDHNFLESYQQLLKNSRETSFKNKGEQAIRDQIKDIDLIRQERFAGDPKFHFPASRMDELLAARLKFEAMLFQLKSGKDAAPKASRSDQGYVAAAVDKNFPQADLYLYEKLRTNADESRTIPADVWMDAAEHTIRHDSKVADNPQTEAKELRESLGRAEVFQRLTAEGYHFENMTPTTMQALTEVRSSLARRAEEMRAAADPRLNGKGDSAIPKFESTNPVVLGREPNPSVAGDNRAGDLKTSTEAKDHPIEHRL